MPAPDLRIGNADRDAAIDRLSEHFAAGRLDKDEFDERSDAVWTAKTEADLAPIFADLEPVRRDRRPQDHLGPWVGRRRHGVPWVPVLVVLIGLTVLTHVPFVLLALLGCAFMVSRRRRRSWHRP